MAYNTELFNTLLNNLTPQAQTQRRELITVNGLNEARGFTLNPGESVTLIDSEKDVFYIKQCDTMGKNTLKVYEYCEITPEELSPAGISKKEFDQLAGKVEEITATIKELKENGKQYFKHVEKQ